ncbi:MAG TPA: 2'-5' RNA ligase family protein [Candidatus Deferrimicrobium sp.]|nr:2'-5' RNA ligase family protein [Candidatus Deferrimicrobium sp.]
MTTAVVARARLPFRLERLRRRWVADAVDGLPAHLTMLYPFVDAARLTAGVRSSIAVIAGRHEPFDYRVIGPARWPGTVYAAVQPVQPFVRLQRDLGLAFPDHPIYGEGPGFAYVPHITIAEDDAIRDDDLLDAVAWQALPVAARVEALEVIVRGDDGRWRTRWRIGLGHAAAR